MSVIIAGDSAANPSPSGVLKAAKKLGIDQEEINEVKFWDGDELAEVELTADGRWVNKAELMEGVENSSSLKPTDVHEQIWRGVLPVLGRRRPSPVFVAAAVGDGPVTTGMTAAALVAAADPNITTEILFLGKVTWPRVSLSRTTELELMDKIFPV